MPEVPTRTSLTRAAHAAIATRVTPGAWVIDATAGNGHDTLFLASCVGPTGRVWACDVQAAALDAARARCAAAGVSERVAWEQRGHETLAAVVPPGARGRIAALVFNLGYLPGSNRAVTTRTATTLGALDSLAPFVAAGGAISIIAYRGHPGGEAEASAVEQWARRLPEESWDLSTQPSPPPGPVWFWLVRR